MFEPSDTAARDDQAIEAVLRAGPRGALALAGIATAIVLLLWLAFYLLVFVPRGPAS